MSHSDVVTLPLPAAMVKFTQCVDEILDQTSDEKHFLPRIGEAMQKLVAEDDWLDDRLAQPHPEYYQQYLIHAAENDRYSVVSFVWGPGQSTPIHDHTVWGVIGVLRGAEMVQNFDQNGRGEALSAHPEARLDTGEVGYVSPDIGDIHRVRNAFDDQVSISIHIYGANIGKTSRHVFQQQNGEPKTFISGYSNKE